MGEKATMAERSRVPLVLLPRDVQVMLDLPSERAALEFLKNNGVAHTRVAGRVFVLAESLLEYLRANEERYETPTEARERADAVVSQIAPTAARRRRGRKPPEVEKE